MEINIIYKSKQIKFEFSPTKRAKIDKNRNRNNWYDLRMCTFGHTVVEQPIAVFDTTNGSARSINCAVRFCLFIQTITLMKCRIVLFIQNDP